MSDLGNLSLKDLSILENHIPELGGFVSRLLAETYDEFVDCLYKDIDKIIRNMEANPQLVAKSGFEDSITMHLIIPLKSLGYNAHHDASNGGHCDIYIEYRSYSWLGEAKLDRGPEYIWGGFEQLESRYSSGVEQQGGMLIYGIQYPDANSRLNNWAECIRNKGLDEFEEEACTLRKLSFFTTHKHSRSGLPFRVRHMHIILHHKPTDKSAKKSKALQ